MHTPVNAQNAPLFYRNYQQPNGYLNDSKDQLYNPGQLNYTQSLMSHRSDSSKFVSPDLEAKNVEEIRYEGDTQVGNARNQNEYQLQESAIPRYSSQNAAVAAN